MGRLGFPENERKDGKQRAVASVASRECSRYEMTAMGTHLSRHRVLVAVGVAFAGMTGCKSDASKAEAQRSSTSQSKSSKAPSNAETPTLETYCKDEPCRRYEDAVAKLERLTPPGSYCMKAETGSCGEFRYV